MTVDRDAANRLAFERMTTADPVLIDVRRALDVVPGMKPNLILTSGAPLPWDQYSGLHRSGILYGAVHEGLAATTEEADEKLRSGDILLAPSHDHACIGPGTAICTASMSVFVVENRTAGNRAYCTFYEGNSENRLAWGSYGQDTIDKLGFVETIAAPVIGEAIRRLGGIPLRPIIERALRLGDELHMRASAAGLLCAAAMFPALLEVAREHESEVLRTLEYFERTRQFWFMRPLIAASKAIADAAHGIEGSSVVTAMTLNCAEFSIRVSGMGGEWFRGGYPEVAHLMPEGMSPSDVINPGGDCIIVEVVGLGAFAEVAAFPNSSTAAKRNSALYDITVGEHPAFRLASFGERGIPSAIDVFKVLDTGIMPRLAGFIISPQGPLLLLSESSVDCFQAAAAAYRERYGAPQSGADVKL